MEGRRWEEQTFAGDGVGMSLGLTTEVLERLVKGPLLRMYSGGEGLSGRFSVSS